MIFRNSVLFDGTQYEFTSGTWMRSVNLRASRNESQNYPSYQYTGGSLYGTHKITLALNTNLATWGTSTSGQTQYANLWNTLSKPGTSMPVIFVDPVGRTYNVVPTGAVMESLAVKIYGNSLTPLNFEVPLTLDESV